MTDASRNVAHLRNFTILAIVSPTEDNGETVHDRVFTIRQALGENRRRPLSQKAFAALLSERAQAMGKGTKFDESMIGRTETSRVPDVDEVEVIASVDPLDRGAAWLAWGETRGVVLPDPQKDRKLSLEEIERAARQAEREARERASLSRAAPAKKKRGRAG